MVEKKQGVIARTEDRPRESWDMPERGDVSWFTLFSGESTATRAMSAGVAEFAPQTGHLALHRHALPEIYHIVEGTGVLTIEGVETVVSTGCSVFIPADAEHGIRNNGESVLRIFYVFPTDRFSDVVYRFPPY